MSEKTTILPGADRILAEWNGDNSEKISLSARHIALLEHGDLPESEQALKNIAYLLNVCGGNIRDTLYLTRGSAEDIRAREILQEIGQKNNSSLEDGNELMEIFNDT